MFYLIYINMFFIITYVKQKITTLDSYNKKKYKIQKIQHILINNPASFPWATLICPVVPFLVHSDKIK